MGVHNNAHVPKESFPTFLWYAIEFFIVLGAAVGISIISIGYFQKIGFTEDMTNWIFWGITGVVYLVYYLIVRNFILKRPVLSKI
jgi:predicted cobalt transporter CbtA